MSHREAMRENTAMSPGEKQVINLWIWSISTKKALSQFPCTQYISCFIFHEPSDFIFRSFTTPTFLSFVSSVLDQVCVCVSLLLITAYLKQHIWWLTMSQVSRAEDANGGFNRLFWWNRAVMAFWNFRAALWSFSHVTEKETENSRLLPTSAGVWLLPQFPRKGRWSRLIRGYDVCWC